MASAFGAEIITTNLQLTEAPGANALTLHVSAPLDQPNPKIVRAVVMIHGAGDDGLAWAQDLEARADRRGISSSTLVVAPWFQEMEDIDAPLPQHMAWADTWTWSFGYRSKSDPALSSYVGLDKIVDALSDRSRFPNLKRIVIAGFSGGGQMTHRYGIVGMALPRAEAAGISISLVIGSSRTYTYFSDRRPQPDGSFGAANLAACPDADEWPYGLTNLPLYRPDPDIREIKTLMQAYLARKQLYLMGADDAEIDSANGCGEEAEGPSRRGRLETYARYLDGLGAHPDVLIVDGFSHDSRVFDGEAQDNALFD
jgi:pimeloyl-ACP methyl ester carboxylesterase